MSLYRIFRRIEVLEAKIPPLPQPVNWYKLLAESGLQGQNRADFEAFLKRINGRELKDLTDQELDEFEGWTILIEEMNSQSTVEGEGEQ